MYFADMRVLILKSCLYALGINFKSCLSRWEWRREKNFMKDYKSEYTFKLKDPRWRKRREEILYRDRYLCQDCWPAGEDEETEHTLNHLRWLYGEDWYTAQLKLQVHHLCYISGRQPWEYEDQYLITLCEECHDRRHCVAWIEKLRSLPSQFGIPILPDGIYSAEDCVKEYEAARNHPNWLAYCREDQRIRNQRAVFYGIKPENLVN